MDLQSKLQRFSKNQKMVKVGDEDATAKWFWLSTNVVDFAKNTLKEGDDVTIRYEDKSGKFWVSFIQKGTTPIEAKPAGSSEKTYSKTWGKSAEEQNSIQRQALIKAASEVVKGALIAVQGKVEVKDIEGIAVNLMTSLYNLNTELIEN